MWAPSETEFLQATNELILSCLSPAFVDETDEVSINLLNRTSRHLCISEHAKRARPLLCLYYHWMFSENLTHDFTRIGVAAEFIHAASLLHDDIIDNAETRRGKWSANRLYGNARAVLAGDYLLTEAFDLLRPFDRVLIDRAIFVVREMTKAASLELSLRGNVDVSLKDLQSIALGKTGVLFSWCGFAAGICGQDLDGAERLWQVGNYIGAVFQMADDLKDFDGDKELKDICRDIRNYEPSIPMVLAMDQNQEIRNKFACAFSQQEIDLEMAKELRDLVIVTGAINETRRRMKNELEQIMSLLSVYRGKKGFFCIEQWISNLAST